MQEIYTSNSKIRKLIKQIEKNGVESFYVNRKRKKKSGGFRVINAPQEDLKQLQRDFADFLSRQVYQEELKRATYITGFVEGRSIVDNAKPHVSSEWVINLDISDFFPSVTENLVANVIDSIEEKDGFLEWMFREQGKTNFYDLQKNQLIKLMTLNGGLPQGSPASPVIANIAAYQTIDRQLHMHLGPHWTYTRYADDITISTKEFYQRDFIQGFANDIIKVVEENTPFKIKREKVNIKHRSQRQVVTGIVVNNSDLGISRKFRNLIRAILHRHKIEDKPLDESYIGILSFIKQVNPAQYEQLIKEFPCKLLTSTYSNQIMLTKESLKLLDQSN